MISLPIDSHINSLIEKIKISNNLILMASPGSGKTTRLPPALVKNNLGKIIVLVPKRIAAVSAADRIAEENGWILGDDVGYHVRFEPMFKPSTPLIFMTVGIFIKKAQDESFWQQISVLVFDEFHERSAESDISLGLAVERQILTEKLKVIVMSATLDASSLRNFLPAAQSVEIAVPPHLLTLNYGMKAQRLICDQDFFNSVVATALQAWSANKKDVLVFLPGLSEIRKVESLLQKKLSSIRIDVLHGSIKLADQKIILQPQRMQNQRRIILATDIAESSLTLPSVDAVVDSGLKKTPSVEPKIGFSQLSIQRISLFSAQQRAGRAARTGPGVCYRLWHQSDELSMPQQLKPEILTSDLIHEILTLKACDVTDIEKFLWLDKPLLKNIKLAVSKLKSWHLIDPEEKITNLGKTIHNLPMSIENSLLFFKLSELGYKKLAANFIAALETQDFAKIFTEKTFSNESDLDRLMNTGLNAQGQKTASQLENFSIPVLKKAPHFYAALIATFFELFPQRIGKRKTNKDGLSSEGRGVSLLPGLQACDADYFILLAGFNSNPSKTDIQFALGFSKQEFLDYSTTSVQIKTNFILDLERKLVFRQQTKSVGNFVISESAKAVATASEQAENWPLLLEENLNLLLNSHPTYISFLVKINFLQKKVIELHLAVTDFDFLTNFSQLLCTALQETTTNLDNFLSSPLNHLLQADLPTELKDLLKVLPDYLVTPNGKSISVNYDTENAPMMSVKIQDLYGWAEHPFLLNHKLPITLELLAPNMRPTQITQNLALFWQKSYYDIRKELRPRYPRHPWPDDPATYKHEKKK